MITAHTVKLSLHGPLQPGKIKESKHLRLWPWPHGFISSGPLIETMKEVGLNAYFSIQFHIVGQLGI